MLPRLPLGRRFFVAAALAAIGAVAWLLVDPARTLEEAHLPTPSSAS